MKYFLSIIIFLFAQIASAQNRNLDSYKNYFNKELKGWATSFTNFNLSEFRKSDTASFENIQKQDFNLLKSFLSVYEPIITFTKDSNKFIDIYSYQLNLEKEGSVYIANPEIDQAVYLCNLKTKFWNRIYFGWIDDVIWISNTKFILVGIEKDKDEKNLPKIFLGDIIKQSFEIFKSTNKNCIQKSNGYQSKKLKNLKIQGL